jgi:hypothetical protein
VCRPPPRRRPPQEIVREQQPCAEQAKAFADCMSYQNGDMGLCDQYFQQMQACRMSLYNNQPQ